MTKVQIAAKCLLTGLVVYAAILLLRPLAQLPYYDATPGTPWTVFLMVLCVGLLVAVWLYVVAIAGRLLPQPAADDDVLAPGQAKRLLAQGLTLTMVLVGLAFLPRSVPTIVEALKLPFVLRGTITEAIIERTFPRVLGLSGAQGLRHLHDLVRMLLALYLLGGAPQLVRWQVARAQRGIGLPSNDSERLGNG